MEDLLLCKSFLRLPRRLPTEVVVAEVPVGGAATGNRVLGVCTRQLGLVEHGLTTTEEAVAGVEVTECGDGHGLADVEDLAVVGFVSIVSVRPPLA